MATAQEQQPPDAAGGASRVPRTLLAAAVVVAAEAVLLLAAGAYLVAGSLNGEPADRGGGLAAGALGVLVGGGLGWVARGLVRSRRWSRSPALLWQLLSLPVAWGMVQSRLLIVGVPLLLGALLALAALIAPATGRALRH